MTYGWVNVWPSRKSTLIHTFLCGFLLWPNISVGVSVLWHIRNLFKKKYWLLFNAVPLIQYLVRLDQRVQHSFAPEWSSHCCYTAYTYVNYCKYYAFEKKTAQQLEWSGEISTAVSWHPANEHRPLRLIFHAVFFMLTSLQRTCKWSYKHVKLPCYVA